MIMMNNIPITIFSHLIQPEWMDWDKALCCTQCCPPSPTINLLSPKSNIWNNVSETIYRAMHVFINYAVAQYTAAYTTAVRLSGTCFGLEK